INGINFISEDVKVAGGKASNIDLGKNTFVFCQDNIIKNGVVAISLSGDNLYVNSKNNFNWLPIGGFHRVDKVENNIIYSIDNTPAREFYQRYIGINSDKTIKRVGKQFPIMIFRNNEYISCPIDGFTEDGGLITEVKLKAHDKIKLGYGDLSNIIINSYKDIYAINEQPIESLCVFSCVSRLILLGDFVEQELGFLKGNKNITGFFTDGEFYHDGRKNVFARENLTIFTMSENIEARMNINKNYKIFLDEQVNTNNYVLYNFIKAVTEDLDDLNKNLFNKIKHKTKKLNEKYYIDSLSNLKNRNSLNEDITYKNMDKLALLDIASFSDINDFYGNIAGDVVLKKMSRYLRDYAEDNNINVYRLNSDVFAFGCDKSYDYNQFYDKIYNLTIKIKDKKFTFQKNKIYINLRVGLSEGSENLIEKSDMALKYLKSNGGSIQKYTDSLNILEKLENNILWAKKINEAIKEDRIQPYFQAVYNNKTKKIDKFECLIRLIERDGTVISPYYFLEISKKAQSYQYLTRIMIDKTFDKFKDLDYDFSVNLSIEDIKNNITTKFILDKLEETKIGKHVIFEIVESEGIENFDEVIPFIEQVKLYGAKIAIDDFGTGYSNLSYLIKLNVDYLKIDGSIIKNIHHDDNCEVVAETIAMFSKKLGIKTIAEFVCEEDIFNKTCNMDIDYSQGYYIAKPSAEI
ncbi:MAG: EAL domain-containing protein, partial [Clostridiaceae bacterium]